MDEIVVHVGYGKTATTTLQRHLFAKHSQIENIGKPYKSEFREQWFDFCFMDSMRYDGNAAKATVRETRRQTDKTIVFSTEHLTSYRATDKGMLAQRIEDVFSPCKILIVLRNQLSIIRSYYADLGRILRITPQKFRYLSFDDWMENALILPERRYLSVLHFFDYIEYYADHFGKENVKIMLYENLVASPDAFITELSGYMNIDAQEAIACIPNKREAESESMRQLIYRRIRSALPMGGRLLPARPRIFRKKCEGEIITSEWIERIQTMYSEGNRRLADKYSLPLKEHGYPV